MKIAICDDCLSDIEYLKDLIKSSELCPANMNFYEYTSGKELLDNYIDFDAVFLDMRMKGMNGKVTAENIRKRDSQVILSFYSGYAAAASQILKCHPFSYIMKDSDRADMLTDIELVLKEIIRKKNMIRLPVTWDGTVFFLHLSDILYISIYNKGSLIRITDEKANEIWGPEEMPADKSIKSAVKMDAYFEQLKGYGFVYASKSYIINSENVVAKLKDSVKMKGGCELSISRSRKKDFDYGFSKYWGIRYNRERVKET